MRETGRIDLGGEHYRVLGVPEDASAHEIRRAYRRLARQHHPDISDHTGAAARFDAICEAYQVLHDPAQRAHYDQHHLPTTPGRPGAVDRQPNPASRPSDPTGSPADQFFGADGFVRTPAWRPPVVPGPDSEAILELSATEAALAATIGITLTDAHGNAIVLPASTRPRQRIRLPGAGRPRQPGGRRGDLLLTVQVRVSTRTQTCHQTT